MTGFWEAMASAGPYANNLHLTADRQPHQHLITQFFTGQMHFLMPNQQRQSTEGRYKMITKAEYTTNIHRAKLVHLKLRPYGAVHTCLSLLLHTYLYF